MSFLKFYEKFYTYEFSWRGSSIVFIGFSKKSFTQKKLTITSLCLEPWLTASSPYMDNPHCARTSRPAPKA